MKAATLAELRTIKAWAEQNYANTLTFWTAFADRTCLFMRGKGAEEWRAASDLYGEFEERVAHNG